MIKLHTYTDSLSVSKEWLTQNIDVSIDEFLATYTWDDTEWLSILLEIEQDEKDIAKVLELLKEGVTTFSKGNQEGLLHPCTNEEYKYQFTYFDEFGAVGDFQRNTLNEMAVSIHEYGFRPQKELRIIS